MAHFREQWMHRFCEPVVAENALSGGRLPKERAPLIACSSSPVRGRPSLFGIAELDNVLADGGVTPGMMHVVEAFGHGGDGCCNGDARAAMAFAAGFGRRSGAPACWIGPPRDLLTPCAFPEGEVAADLLIIETRWGPDNAVRLEQVAAAGGRVLVLDIRRAERLSPPLRLARAAARRGFAPVLLARDAAQLAAHTDAPEAAWRIGSAPGSTDVAADRPCWQVELARGETVRRVLVQACDGAGRMAPAPRNVQPPGGKEMMRRFTRV